MEIDTLPSGRLIARSCEDALTALFHLSSGAGILQLLTRPVASADAPATIFFRDFAGLFLRQLCLSLGENFAAPPITETALIVWAERAPLMKSAHPINATFLQRIWMEMSARLESLILESQLSPRDFIAAHFPEWQDVGRLNFHLAENSKSLEHPFAFLATIISRVGDQGRLHHMPLGAAIKQLGLTAETKHLASLMKRIEGAAACSPFIRELLGSGNLFKAMPLSIKQTHAFLADIDRLENEGIAIRVPSHWQKRRPKRVMTTLNLTPPAGASPAGLQSLLSFKAELSLDGKPLTQDEIDRLLAADECLMLLRGEWVEIDRAKLQLALSAWQNLTERPEFEGLRFGDALRLVAGTKGQLAASAAQLVTNGEDTLLDWTNAHLPAELDELFNQESQDKALTLANEDKAILQRWLAAQPRPYQEHGIAWLYRLYRLRLGGCLADDMGLGKTLQVIGLMTLIKGMRHDKGYGDPTLPHLIVMPASLLGNWQDELTRFAPHFKVAVWHPSAKNTPPALPEIILTTYGMLSRIPDLSRRPFGLVVLDEAQQIKSSGTRQAALAKQLQGLCRLALTGTPVENKLTDLWSIIDFACPGLLGGEQAFQNFLRQGHIQEDFYEALRRLIKPFILRRLKTDRSIIADLPDKVELKSYCFLSREQAAHYHHTVEELRLALFAVSKEKTPAQERKRRGLILGHLLQLKKICNHPSQFRGDERYDASASGKLRRLREIAQLAAENGEKLLVFTQFRQITAVLARHLEEIFGQRGLILHGQTPVPERRELVAAFQKESGPPFFVLSVKAGGTGLNLTAASQVVHFDRWWNPAVEDQATDRAYRIGQKRQVMVHKLISRGTIEDKIDQLIEEKKHLARHILAKDEGLALTQLSNDELLEVLALDKTQAGDSEEALLDDSSKG